MSNDVNSFNYLSQDELAALNEKYGTSLKGDRYLSVNPNTGEEGIWKFEPIGGWMNMTTLQGPRTHYEDGTPVTSFADINRNWTGRLYDIYRLVGEELGSSKTELGLNQDRYSQLTGISSREEGFNQLATNLARSDKSWDEIYAELVNFGRQGSQPTEPLNGFTVPTIGTTGGAFTGTAPTSLGYSPTQLPSAAPPPSIQNVDYVKLLRGWLTNSLFKDLI